MRRIAQKIRTIKELKAAAAPALPVILDSLLLQRTCYETTHLDSGLSFSLHPGCGDWFTFFECCIRQDYFPDDLHIRPGDHILDIGGNFGAFSLLAAQKTGPTGTVYCFEPSPKSAERIRGHMAQNGMQNIRLSENAVGGTAGTIALHLHAKSALNTTQSDIDGRSSNDLKTIHVEQIAISDVLKALPGPIAFAKIDCEGSEYEIMDHITATDLSRINAISIETHNVPGRNRRDILSKLEDNGFNVRDGNPFIAIRAS